MSKYDLLNSFDAENAIRTFDEFYEYQSVVTKEKYMCFSSTLKLVDNLIASVSICKYNMNVHFFDLWDHQTINVIFTDNDPDGAVQFFDNTRILDDDCLVMFPCMDDIQDSDLEKARLSRQNLIVLYNLHNELMVILKKDETIQKVVV